MTRFIPKKFAENSTTSVVFGSFQEQGGNVGDGTISSDPATLQGGTAWPLGWKAATDNFIQIPRGEEMEGLERVLSAAIVQQFTDGLTFWQSEMPVTQYQTIVQYQTGSDLPKLYVNITGTSTSTTPDSDTTNWKEMSLGGNTPFFFGWSQYFENDPYNASWLASNGQYNAASVYPDFWTHLTGVELNSSLNVGDTIEISGKTYVKRGLPVKLSTDTYDDYDFVVNQDDQTFRLPLKSRKVGGGSLMVFGNGNVMPLWDSKYYSSPGFLTYGSGYSTNLQVATPGQKVGTTLGSGVQTATAKGLPTKQQGVDTGVVADLADATNDGLKLYFYVGDTVQDASLINAGAILGQLANKVDIDASNFNADGKSLLSGFGMPSDRYIDLTLGASGSTYTAPANGWFTLKKAATNAGQYAFLHTIGTDIGTGINVHSGTDNPCYFLPIKKGGEIKIDYTLGGATTYFRFIYAEGEN